MNGLHLLLALTLGVGLWASTTRPRVTWWTLRISLVLCAATGIHYLVGVPLA